MANKTALEELKERAAAIKAKASGGNNEPVAEESATGETALEQLKKRADTIKAKASAGGTVTGTQQTEPREAALEKLRQRAEAIRNRGTVKDKPMMATPTVSQGTPGAASQEQVRSWVNRSMALMRDAESYYGNWSGKEGNWDEEIRKTAVGLMRDLSSVKAAYTGNQEALDAIDGVAQNLLNVYKGIETARKHYGQWDTQEAYDKAVADYNTQQEALSLDVEKTEAELKAMEAERKQLMDMGYAVIKAQGLQPKIDQLAGQIQEKKDLLQKASDVRKTQENAEQQQKALALDLEKTEGEIKILEANLEHLKNLQANTFDKEKLAQMGPQITQMEQELREKKNLFQTARNLQGQKERSETLKQLETVSGNADFKANSGYDASYGQEGVHDPHTYEAMEYDHINGEISDVSNRYFKDKHYDQMEKNEVAVYNYYFKTQGIQAAKVYLDSLQETLNYRYAQSALEGYRGQTGKELLFGVKAGWDQATSGLKNLDKMVVDVITGKDSGYIAPSGTQMLSGMIREDLDQNAGKLGTTGYDIINTSANMLPSILASTAVGLIATPGVGSTVGAAMMGGGAAGNAYQEVLNLGFSPKEAAAYGTAIGISEAALERVLGGIGKLGGTSAKIAEKVAGIENGIARFCLRFGGKIGSEALEEGLQSILEPGLSNWILDTDKDVDWSEVAYSALLGGLTGGVFGVVELGTEAVAGTANSQQTAPVLNQRDGSTTVNTNFTQYTPQDMGVNTEVGSIKDQLRGSQETLNAMEPVTSITTPKNFAEMDLEAKKNWMIEKLRPTGYSVERKGFGIIDFAQKKLRAAFNYFKKGSADEAAFEALPYVLEKGVEISSREDHKGRKYSTVTFAAPVIINGQRGNMAVVVRQTQGNQYKVHRVLLPDGSAFNLSEIENEAESSTTRGVADTGSLASSKDTASANIIDQGDGIVNPGTVEGQVQTKNELYRQMVQQNQNGGNVNVETRNDADAAPGNLVHDGGQGWNAGTGTGEPVGGLAEGTAIREEGPQSGAALAGDQGTGVGEAAADRSGDSRVKVLQRLASQLKLPRVSSLSLGIPEGTEKTSIRVLPQETWTPELQEVARNVQQETELPVTFVLGRIPVKNRRSGVRAVYTPTGIIIQADNMGATPQQLADHETYHFKADEARRAQLNQQVAERLLKTYTQEELSRALDKYKENLVGIVDDEGLTEEEYLEVFNDAVLEEFLADAYAGINAFGAHAERYQGDVEGAMDELYMGKARNQDNGTRQTNGPNEEQSTGAKYSSVGSFSEEAKIFAEDVQQWNKNGRDEKAPAFILGSTGDILQGLGAIESDIYMLPEKINRILQEHPEMTPEIIQKIPQILEDPILILKSRNVGGGKHQNTRLVIFGAVKATDGRPVMSVLDLRPVENNLVIDDMQKVSSAYTKDNNPISFIRNSDILHADEKRTAPLLRTIGFQMPIELQQSGSIGSISYQGQNVKLWGEKFTDVVRESESTQNTNGEEWVSVFDLPFNEQMEAMAQGRYDNETKRVRLNKPAQTDTQKANSQAVENPKKRKSKFSADDLSAMEEELQMRESQEYQDRLMEDGGSAAWVKNQKRIEALRQQMKRDPEIIQKRNERDVQTEGTEPAKVRVPKKKDAKKPAPVSESKPILAKQDLRKNLLHFFSVPEGERQELGAVIDAYADRLIKNGALTEEDRRRFFDRMYASGVMEVPADELYTAGRELLRGGRIYVNDSIRAEFGDDWQDFRRQAFAAGIFLTSNKHDGGVDHVNSYMAEYLPSLFDSEETDLRMALERIVQVAEEGKSQQVSLAEYTAQLAGEQNVPESEFLDAMERHLDWALRTFAEKAELEVKLRDRTGVKIAQEREAAEQSRYKQSAREEARRLKERKERMELREQQRQQKELRELQQKTLKSLQWLSKNRQRAPEELRETWDEVLGDIDLFAVSAANEMRWSDRYGATWKDLAEMYQEAKDKDPNFMPSKDLERIVSRLNDKKIGEMDIGALQDLYKAAVGLQKEFHNRNNVINDEMNRMFEEVYEDSKVEIESAPGGFKSKRMDKLFNMQQLTPMNVLQRMGGWDPNGTFFSMAKQLERGERDIRAYTVKANRMLEEFLTEHEDWVKKCDGQGKDGIWYEMEVPEVLELNMGHKPIFGDTFKVYFTPAQKVHMYLESKNLDNLRHMLGGRTFVDKELYSEGKRQEALSQGRTVRLAPETVKAMVANLTDEERALADVLERYYNTFAKEEINRVSNALYGYDKAMGKNYAPIFSNQNYTKSELGVYDATAEGVGHMKGRVAYSKNPSYNISALDAFEKHVDQTARFTGMAIPARNWNTLLNWRVKNYSTGEVITHKWGDEGKKYIEGIIKNLQAGTAPETDMASQLAEKALSNYISAVFGANPSIVLKQMGSIPMAAPYLDFKNFPTPAQIKNIDRDLIAKYTQDLAWRTMGYTTKETKQLKDNPNWTQTNKPVRFVFGGGAITAMDGWAASTLWPWAENKVRRDFPDLEEGTDAYYKKVAELFEYAMSRSQSVSDETHQSTMRKSKKSLARALTMFRSDSAQTYNTIRQKIGEARYYKRIGADAQTQKKANKAVGTAFVASLSGLIWAEGISLIMALWKNKGKDYRDDEDELTAESIMGEVAMNLLTSMAGVVIGGEELAGILGIILTGEKWYDLEAPEMEQLNEIINALTDAGGGVRDIVAGMWEVAENGGDVGKYLEEHISDIVGGVKDLAETAAKYFAGLPVANVEAYLLGLLKWCAPGLTTAYEDALATANKAGLSGLTGDALEVRVGNIMEQRGVESDAATEVLAGLYEAGYSSVVPGTIPAKVTIDGEENELNLYQQQVYGNIWGSVVADHLETVVSSELFEDADAKMQSKLIQALYSYADAKANAELFDTYELPSSIKGMDDALKSGLSMEKVLDLKVNREKEEAGTGTQGYTGKLKDYMEMVENGVDPDEAHELVMHLEELEPEEGKNSVSNLQECWEIANWPWQESMKEDALKAIMSDSGYEKYMSCREAGVLTYWYFTFLNDTQDMKSDYDANGKAIKGSTKKDKVVAAIDGYERLTPKQKDALYLAADYAESGLKDCPWNQ